ncbi:MAG: Ketopantoate reductase PanE/ApbA terminal [Solirubrobacterales bacterium]|jgi:ketopantoate reductase|nr:Ketopantoate reductase PanE/ApbA terminal [Solirubrobacterales bacterium]
MSADPRHVDRLDLAGYLERLGVAVREPILAALEGAPDAFRSSMQKDVAAGRVPELDAIVGPILRGGSEHGIDVSATRALADRIVTPG